MTPYIKDENACNAIKNWLKSLKYEPFTRCLISFVGIPLDEKFVKTIKEHDIVTYADFFKVKIKALIGDIK